MINNQTKCTWISDEEKGWYNTGCNKHLLCGLDGLDQEEFKWCPFCGRETVEKASTGDSEHYK